MLRRLIVIAAVLATPTPTLALDLPARRPGLWEKIEPGPSTRPQISRVCIDAAVDQLLWRHDLGDGTLCPIDVGSSGGAITVDYSCRVREVTMTMHVMISGDFTRAYTWDITSSYEATGRAMPPPNRYTMAYRYIGPCEADLLPGEMITNDDKKTPLVRAPNQP